MFPADETTLAIIWSRSLGVFPLDELFLCFWRKVIKLNTHRGLGNVQVWFAPNNVSVGTAWSEGMVRTEQKLQNCKVHCVGNYQNSLRTLDIRFIVSRQSSITMSRKHSMFPSMLAVVEYPNLCSSSRLTIPLVNLALLII